MTVTASIYRPTHQQQKRTLNGKLIGCTETSAAMFADAVTLGGTKTTEAGIRALSSEPTPDPASPGLNIPQVIAALWKLRIAATDKSGESWDDLRRYLQADRRIILQHDMFYLGDECGGANHVGHCMILQAERRVSGKTRILGNNPMCTGPKWYGLKNLRLAAEAFGDQTGVPGNGIRFAVSRVVPRIAVGY